MGVIDWIGFILTVLGAYNLLQFLLGLLPANLIPHVSIRLNELEASLDNPEAVDAIPSTSQFRIDFAILYNQFLRMRTTSHRSPLFYQQLRLALSGLTCQLYIIYVQAGAIRREVEVVMDEYRLASLATVQSATPTALPAPAATAVPAANVAAPAPPPPAAAS
jgi:hypothetical protein